MIAKSSFWKPFFICCCAGADIMPRSQLEQTLQSELGSEWRSKLADFDYEAMAAASIGQVHAATLHDGRRVAMKIQCELAFLSCKRVYISALP
jgi:hypothetical protein